MADSAGNLVDQWYYLDGQETRGPVPAADIVKLIQGGSLSAAAQVAQAGWQSWSPASVALARFLTPQPHQLSVPVAKPEPLTRSKSNAFPGPIPVKLT